MRRSADFSSVVRAGVRVRKGSVVVHQYRQLHDDPTAAATVGLVVGRGVGPSVVRHRVSRRLRAQLCSRLDVLPPGSGTVVRALPEAARATSAQLGADLDRALATSRTRARTS
jgi:ribonuclease P protein component